MSEPNLRDLMHRAAATLLGAVLFVAGSCCFVAITFQTNWLGTFRSGCTIWIAGCIPYLILGTIDARRRLTLRVVIVLCAMVVYSVGCGLAFVSTVESVLKAINACFAVGSALLFVDAALEIRLRWPSADKVCAIDLIAGALFMIRPCHELRYVYVQTHTLSSAG
jgi:hypothetical protein